MLHYKHLRLYIYTMRNALITDMAWLNYEALQKTVNLTAKHNGNIIFKIVHYNSTARDILPYVPTKGYEMIDEVYHYDGWYYLALIYKIKKPGK